MLTLYLDTKTQKTDNMKSTALLQTKIRPYTPTCIFTSQLQLQSLFTKLYNVYLYWPLVLLVIYWPKVNTRIKTKNRFNMNKIPWSDKKKHNKKNRTKNKPTKNRTYINITRILFKFIKQKGNHKHIVQQNCFLHVYMIMGKKIQILKICNNIENIWK